MERDTFLKSSGADFKISTHTLTWSVTWWCDTITAFELHFNSHAHVERDLKQVRYSTG